MSSNPGDLTPIIGRAFDSARRLKQVCPTGKLFLMRRRQPGYGWEPLILIAADEQYNSINGEIFRGWLPQAALGRGPLKVQIVGLDPFTPEISKQVQGLGYMQSISDPGAKIYQILPEHTIVPTLPSQRRWEYTAVLTDEPLYVPIIGLEPLNAPLAAALGG